MTSWHRALTPLGWIAVATVLFVLLVAFAGFDPLGLRARKMEQLKRQAEVGVQAQQARQIEARENERVEQVRSGQAEGRAIIASETGKLMGEAANDPSGQSVLGADRLGRLQQHDRVVCEHASVGACQSATGSAH